MNTDRMNTDLLRQRAERLAAPTENRSQDFLELLSFWVQAERYAFLLSDVRAVLRGRVTPMPGAPAWIAGAINVRGSLVSVLDLGRALGMSGDTQAEAATSVLLLDSSFGAVGCRIVGAPELLRVSELDMQAPPAGSSPAVRGVAAGSVALLDLNGLLEARR